MPNIQPSSYLAINGIRLHYQRAGEPSDSRPTLVLVHGFGASHQSWHDVFSHLTKSHSTVRVDLKGFGFSDKPDDGNYRPEDQANLLSEFIRRLPDRQIVVVGHSYGGGVALLTQLILQEAKTDATSTVGIVLIDAAVLAQDFPFFISNLRNPLMAFLTERLTTPRWRTRYVLQAIFFNKAAVTKERVYRYAYFLRLDGAERAMRKVAQQIKIGDSFDIVPRLHEITIPVLIIWGENDPVIPLEHGEMLATKIPHARLQVLPYTGHVPHEERPKETLELLNSYLRQFDQ
jgi:pimeloyl-ACP methyl ester carboxylesterase